MRTGSRRWKTVGARITAMMVSTRKALIQWRSSSSTATSMLITRVTTSTIRRWMRAARPGSGWRGADKEPDGAGGCGSVDTSRLFHQRDRHGGELHHLRGHRTQQQATQLAQPARAHYDLARTAAPGVAQDHFGGQAHHHALDHGRAASLADPCDLAQCFLRHAFMVRTDVGGRRETARWHGRLRIERDDLAGAALRHALAGQFQCPQRTRGAINANKYGPGLRCRHHQSPGGMYQRR